ncbi:aspartate kinase [Fodinisporobacter ferrooxydans]|uniref:Aspartokinase n=1 Tax=Fodinisporobacter ferrooxydans TaxID=2901836 RepID=A0ABY4CJI6_9BACL|nr:aspartate kinase [Alicyclobacillaceae bacterium MYW30-H2]
MRILVQKFGGTSLATEEMRLKAVEHVEAAIAEGYRVVVVVSAMGRRGDPYATDTLLSLVSHSDALAKRELDLLMSCGELISGVVFAGMLRKRGRETSVLTGEQAGIVTSDDFSNAQIQTIRTARILQEMEKGRIVVVTGFQGATADGETTTLGRGGSDTTATALGVALDAEYVDIFTDVEGIMTADPRIVDEARQLKRVTYTEICNLAYLGAKVIHPRAVEIAMQKNIPIRVRSTASQDAGTLVTSATDVMEGSRLTDRVLTGVTQTANVTQIRISRTPDSPFDLPLRVFDAMANNEISVDFINVTPNEILYTVTDMEAEKAIRLLKQSDIAAEIRPGCAKIAAVGAGIHGVPGVLAKIVEALTEQEIEILQTADSHTTIWCLVRGEDMVAAVRALHQKFALHK